MIYRASFGPTNRTGLAVVDDAAATAAAASARLPRSTADTGSVPILMYHQVSDNAVPALARYTVTPGAFAAQMRWLHLAGYTPTSLDRLIASRSGELGLPARPVVITFDDGFRDLLEHAVPTLRSFGFTATFFLVAGLVDSYARWLERGSSAGVPLMGWPAIRGLADSGFAMGAHTMSHPRLTTLTEPAIDEELRGSRTVLEDRLGCQVAHLAYPFGDFDERVRSLAGEAGFRTACSTRPAICQPSDDPLALPRISVYGHDSLLSFICRVRTAQTPRQLSGRVLSALLRRR